LKESGVPVRERKKVIDKVAAGIILQSYLDSQKGAASQGLEERNDSESE
jgi:RNase H-fold protein (predicted Holliday junction resolvase)